MKHLFCLLIGLMIMTIGNSCAKDKTALPKQNLRHAVFNKAIKTNTA